MSFSGGYSISEGFRSSGRISGTMPFDEKFHPPSSESASGLLLSVFEGDRLLLERDLTRCGKARLTFGAADDNDLVVRSSAGIVSRHHGSLVVQGTTCTIVDEGSTNGLYFNGVKRPHSVFAPGDVVSVGHQGAVDYESITFLLNYADSRWRSFPLDGKVRVTLGRAIDNDIVLPSSAVSACHALLLRDQQGGWSIADNDSFNGTFVNGAPVIGLMPLTSGDVIALAGASAVFIGDSVLYSTESAGVEVVARDLVQTRKVHGGVRVTNDHVSLHVRKGEFVAIVGGSGSGKTTLLSALSGSDPATSGTVGVDGVDLYANYGVLKNAIGLVPQQDIVYDNLKLIDMLRYAAELRMPPDSTKQERETRAGEVLELLELMSERDNLIKCLSGGQKKRASIAVELLADPHLLFLDEPTSGLDPGIEQSLMEKLAAMAHAGRTIMLVTHTTLNLHLCDQVVFLGPGGTLCFAGLPQGALEFFGVDDFVGIYQMIAADPKGWAKRFATSELSESLRGEPVQQPEAASCKRSPSFVSQLSTLSRRYVRLLMNDTQRLVLLVLQAPLLAMLICMVAGDDCFTVYEGTKSCLFALSCAAFWIGILDSIQEICKERVILKREYAGGLKLGAYVLSKVLVLGALCVVQSVLLTGVFCAFEGVPSDALWNPMAELFFTVLLTTLSAMCLGLAISALFRNPDRAIAVAPILIMPQILFSGLIFKLEGAAEKISIFVNCRWGMEAFGTTANLNALDLSIYESDFIDASIYEHEWEAAFEYTTEHLMQAWGVLSAFCLVCLVVCGVVLRVGIRK